MKKLLKTGTFLFCLIACFYCSQNRAALAASSDTETVITYDNGKTVTKSGVLNPEKLTDSQIEAIDSFDVEYKDEIVLQVVSQDNEETTEEDESIHYFSVDFVVSEEENTSCFLAGLTEENVKTVEDTIISSLKNGASAIDMENIDFIDTEKIDMNDTQLCWAASSCNVLDYTGWLNQTEEFTTSDDLFEYVSENITDEGGNETNLFSWFFNGVYNTYMADFTQGTGQFVDGYAYTTLTKDYLDINPRILSSVIDSMRNGYGATFGVHFEGYSAGHSTTLWGFIMDNDYPETSQKHFTHVFITDSDNDYAQSQERACNPNKMEMYPLEPSEDGSWTVKEYLSDETISVLINEIVTVKPYSEEIEKETDPTASLDMKRSPDLDIEELDVASVCSEADLRSSVPAGQTFSVSAFVQNVGKSFGSSENIEIPYEYTVFNEDGVAVKYGNGILGDSFVENDFEIVEISMPNDLPLGHYTVNFNVNMDKSVKEAFYIDNEETIEFDVVSSKYDIAALNIEASVSDYQDGEGTVTFAYTGMDELLGESGLTCKIYEEDYITDGYGAWECVYNSSDEDTLLPEKLTSYQYSDIKYAFIFNNGEDVDNLVVFTDIAPSYDYYELERQEDDDSDLTNVRVGAVSLLNGEQIKGRLIDRSTKERQEDKTLTLKVVAQTEDEDANQDSDSYEFVYKTTDLYTGSITLAAGEKEKEFVVPDTWENPLTDIGYYTITAILLDGEKQVADFELGYLMVQEKGSLKVTTLESDFSDGKTSLAEAIEYANETNSGKTITFASGLDEYYLWETCTVSGNVVIDGAKGRTKPIKIYSENVMGTFVVTKDASLTMSNMTVSGTSVEHLTAKDEIGAISSVNGAVVLDNCTFEDFNAYRGAAVSIKNGSLKMSNCSCVNLYASAGAAIFARGDAKVDLLNCSILNCLSEGTGAAIYDYTNDDGYCNVVNSTILCNSSRNSGASIEGSRTCNVLNSIVISSKNPNSGYTSFSSIGGDAHVYGSYIGTSTVNVVKDKSTVSGTIGKIAYTDIISGLYTAGYDTKNNLQLLPRLRTPVSQGNTVKAENGKLVLVDAGGSTTVTDVDAVFTDYSKDIARNSRGSYYGAYAKVYTPVKQTITVKTTSRTILYKKVKSKAQTFKISASANTSLTYVKTKGNSKIKVTKAGKVTVAKKMKKGTYTIYVKITAANSSEYASATKKAKIKIIVK